MAIVILGLCLAALIYSLEDLQKTDNFFCETTKYNLYLLNDSTLLAVPKLDTDTVKVFRFNRHKN